VVLEPYLLLFRIETISLKIICANIIFKWIHDLQLLDKKEIYLSQDILGGKGLKGKICNHELSE
jgi:hypothetical protein